MAIHLALRRLFFVDELVHEAHVVIFSQLPLFMEIGALVLRHRLDEVFDQLVWNQRVAEIKLCYVWLSYYVSHLEM